MKVLLATFLALHFTLSSVAQLHPFDEKISRDEMVGRAFAQNARLHNANSVSENFDVHYYKCEWEVDPALKYIKGVVTVNFSITQAGNSIFLDLHDNLNVSKVEHLGANLVSKHTNHTLEILFPEVLPAGEEESIKIFYEGIPGAAFHVSMHGNLVPDLWTLSEPFGSKDWWPCKNGLDDKADSVDVYIKHPAAYKAVSNGMFQSMESTMDGGLLSHWKHKYPIASYLICLGVTNYTEFSQSTQIGSDPILMQTFCYPENQPDFQKGAQKAMEIMSFYSATIGPYPFIKEKYGHVQFGWGGGMEHQTCSFMVNMSENLIAHELAHQWFGNQVTCADWEDVWLNEGLTSFMSEIYLEHKYPGQKLSNRKAAIDYITSQPGGSVKVEDVTSFNRIFDNRLSYAKGAHILYMLRWILGDTVFFQALNAYLNDPSLTYGFASTEQLKGHFENASGRDLTYFFSQWYSGQGFPAYKLEWFPSASQVQIKLTQVTSHASVSFFKLPVPVLFRNSDTGQEKLITLTNSFNGQHYIENLGFEATDVIIDPESWLITKNNTAVKVMEALPVVFKAVAVLCSEGVVTLDWETSDEQHTESFEVEKSADALSWSVIGEVKAAGGSSLNTMYRFADISNASSRQFYRVTALDEDGSRQSTSIKSSDCLRKAPAFVLSPNPVVDHLVVNHEDKAAQELLIEIYDLKGIRIFCKTLNSGSGQLNISFLPGGEYIIRSSKSDGAVLGTANFIKQ